MNIIVLSDHGMVDLAANKTILLDSIINMEDIERYIQDPMTMIQPRPGRVEKVYQQLKEAENHYTVYKKEDLPKRYHLKESRRVMDIIMMAEMPYTILTSDDEENFVENLPQGTHGYDNQEKKMHAFFAARGPDFKTGDTVSSFKNIHVYALMAHLLNLEPAPHDGTLDSVKMLMNGGRVR
ncbi:MAG: alkaline phosphatase family protein [Balneolaceae bacterium]|nr:alkaline phosphatase family protein [Balneolaceae bacterium]